jgi:hypothetical protein
MKPLAPHFGQELAAAGLNNKVSFSAAGDLFYHDPDPESLGEMVSRLTDEEEAALMDLVDAHDPDIAPTPTAPRQVVVVAIAELTITEEVVSGVETSVNIGGAFALEPHDFWIFFGQPQPDASYLVFVQAPGFYADVVDRQPDYFEVQIRDRVTNEPAAPSSFSISVQRVQ